MDGALPQATTLTQAIALIAPAPQRFSPQV
jgi:hypothetical protein